MLGAERQLRRDAPVLRRRAEQVLAVRAALPDRPAAPSPRPTSPRSAPSCAAGRAGSRAPAPWSSRSGRRGTDRARWTARACRCRWAMFPASAGGFRRSRRGPGLKVSRRITVPRGSVISSRSGSPSKRATPVLAAHDARRREFLRPAGRCRDRRRGTRPARRDRHCSHAADVEARQIERVRADPRSSSGRNELSPPRRARYSTGVCSRWKLLRSGKRT